MELKTTIKLIKEFFKKFPEKMRYFPAGIISAGKLVYETHKIDFWKEKMEKLIDQLPDCTKFSPMDVIKAIVKHHIMDSILRNGTMELYLDKVISRERYDQIISNHYYNYRVKLSLMIDKLKPLFDKELNDLWHGKYKIKDLQVIGEFLKDKNI